MRIKAILEIDEDILKISQEDEYDESNQENENGVICGLIKREIGRMAESGIYLKNYEIIPDNIADHLCMYSKLGKLVASPSFDPDYPGIYINFIPNDDSIEIPLVLAEYFPDNYEIRLIWGDTENEDYTYKIAIIKLKNDTGINK